MHFRYLLETTPQAVEPYQNNPWEGKLSQKVSMQQIVT